MSDELRAGSARTAAEDILRGEFDKILVLVAVGALEIEIERRNLQFTYMQCLADVCGVELDYTKAIAGMSMWVLLRATPEQRARAFLEAMKGAAE
jgi:hypothetical protein